MAYTKPPANNMPFRFTSSGYTGPSGGNISYNFGAAGTANLQAAINVLSEDYLKECPTYTIAYGGKIQIIQLPCVYGGYRHLNAYIYGNPEHADLGAFIRAVVGQGNLGAYIRGVTATNLPAQLHGWATSNLPAYLFGWAVENLSAYIYGYPPVDLSAILNIIEISNLPAYLNGILFKGQTNLNAYANGYPPIDLPAYIYGWGMVNLAGEINSVYKTDLPAIIQSTTISDLAAYLSAIDPINLPANIHGWATADLQAILIGGYGPGDLQAYLNAVPFQNLSAYIKGLLGIGVPYDLQGIVEGWYSFNLGASISLIYPADLNAYIFAAGKIADLPASIVPRVIYLKQAIRVALLEHLDLGAMINSSCFASGSADLNAYFETIYYKKDLRAVIFGYEGNIYSNAADLATFINIGVVGVEGKRPINFVPQPLKYTILRVKFATKQYRVFDTLRILFSSYPTADLPAIVTGILESANLPAYVKAVFDWNYSELPPYVNPKTHEIVIDFDDHGYENWRRFVEIFFDFTGDSPYHYFYVSGADKVYRVDRDRHWVVRAKSYQRVSGMIERRSVRRKYIFKMSDYANVDEAVRDLIDRVSTYRRADLGAYINAGVFCPHSNLGASIYPIVKYSWVKHLHASITGTGGFLDLSATITGYVL